MTGADSRMFLNRTYSLIFAALPLLYAALSLIFGYHPEANPRSAQLMMQTIDLEWIRENFWQCLVYNHYQPPLFSNIILGALYCWVRPWTTHAFLLLNIFTATAAFVMLIKTLGRSAVRPLIAVMAASAFLFYPYRWFWEGTVLYMSLSCSFLTIVLWSAAKFFEKPGAKRFWLLIAPVVASTLLNSFFHWMWGLVTLGLALCLSKSFPHRKWHLLAAAALLLAVPLKNWSIFGTFSNSSCSGIVLSQRVGAFAPLVVVDIRDGKLPKEAVSMLSPYAAETYLSAHVPIPEKYKNIRCLTEEWKGYRPDGFGVYSFFNYNHYSMISVSRNQSKSAIQYLLRHPQFYVRLTLPQTIDFFSSTDARWDPGIALPKKIQYKGSNGISYRSLVYIFSIFVSVCYLWRMRQNRGLVWKILVFALFQLAFAMGMGILIAYSDGARYRFPFETTFIFVSAVSASLIADSIFKKLHIRPA